MLANDNIQIALIGAGGMGQGDAHLATSLPGVKLVAACDLYTGRLDHMKEVYPGIATTRDYREILARRDVDAIIIGTPDHWHSTISVEAMNAGKDVYCEKPMIQRIDQGHPMIEAQKKTGRILQIGSQYASSPVFLHAGELIKQGAIGKVNMVESWLDRNTAIGAWQYSIPPDASPTTVDWERFLGNAPKRPFDATRFFRWRNYRDYGTGVAGDLFVHLITGLHTATGSIGPNRIYATGGLRYWKDGRDVPDVMLATMDYSDFTFALRVNFKSGSTTESFGFRFVGDEGVMTTSMNELQVAKHPREKEPGFTVETFSKAEQERSIKAYYAKYPASEAALAEPDDILKTHTEMNVHLAHHRNFYEAVRTRKPHFEDAVFGLRAAGPALLTNISMWESRVCKWDPETMTAS